MTQTRSAPVVCCCPSFRCSQKRFRDKEGKWAAGAIVDSLTKVNHTAADAQIAARFIGSQGMPSAPHPRPRNSSFSLMCPPPIQIPMRRRRTATTPVRRRTTTTPALTSEIDPTLRYPTHQIQDMIHPIFISKESPLPQGVPALHPAIPALMEEIRQASTTVVRCLLYFHPS